jgi:signal transduction histidine kinase
MESSNKDAYDILIVEDSPTQARELEIFFRKRGFGVTTAVNGREGIVKTRRFRPDLIVSDVNMPEMNGYEMCRLIKQDPALKDVPIILLTTLTDPADVIEALNVNADCYVSKPYDENHLLAKIDQLLTAPGGEKIDRPGEGLDLDFAGKHFTVTSNRSQILTLLISIYEDTAMKNRELISTKEALEDVNEELGNKLLELQATKEELKISHEDLEIKVRLRTADLKKINETLGDEIAQREKAEEALQNTLTDLKRSQAVLIETEKIAALGTLTAGVAHELNNPMMGILNFVEYCIKKTSPEDRRYEVLKDADREVRRCIKIVQNLLTFARIKRESEEDYRRESCEAILDRVIRLLTYRTEKEGVTITRTVGEDTPEIMMRVSNIQQVFLNLISNALDAIQGTPKKEISLHIMKDGDFVRIKLTDTGGGISPENLPKIFDPFFTTKVVGQGTGLGLSISKSIIKSHGGEITCMGLPGSGATFDILLPISQVSKKEDASE